MAIEQIDIEKFLQFSHECPILDVRSPGEFLHAHVPGALPVPLFTNEQRKIIGIAYKQQSRQVAVKKGLDFFSERMKEIPVEAEELITKNQTRKSNRLLIHCWRGGMRSGAVAWLLDLYGFKVYILKGGYKSFRNWVLSQFEKKYKINVLGGYTGSGKTDLLKEFNKTGNTAIDLENLANHKGSAFGGLGEQAQPGQEMFENLLAFELYKTSGAISQQPHLEKKIQEIWIEDESRHIGAVGIPLKFWEQMREGTVYFLDIPFEQRLKHIVSIYGVFDKKELVTSIMRIQKKLGGLETKKAINFLLESKIEESFSILLSYYDKLYTNSLFKRENIETLLKKIPCATVDIGNTQKFISQTA